MTVSVDLQQGEQTTTLASDISYAPFGPVTSMTYGNGHTLSQGVDSAYRFTDHTVSGALQLINSLYDANGNLSQVDNSLTTISNVYNYDALNRLDTAKGTFGSQDFGYDKNGNRHQWVQDGNTLTYAYEANSNRLDIAANDDVSIDPNGNITSQGLWAYTHTTHNRLVSVSNDSMQVGAYAYNGLGQRISKTVNSVTQSYVYGLSGELLQQTDSTASVEYVYLNGQPLAVVQDGNVYYLHNDHLGTPRAVTDVAKTVVWRWDSDPFGTTAANEDPDNDGIVFTLNLRFPGQYYDSETGLHYNYFRYYDPSTGRYITADPLGIVPNPSATQAGLNHLYVYAKNNAVNLTDPYGLLPVMPWPEFGPVCGSGANTGMIPDGIYKQACENHDRCYSTCGKSKQECDEAIVMDGAPIYALVLMLSRQAQEAYDNAQREAGCNDCNK
jgi:RHS repeat-associated protein